MGGGGQIEGPHLGHPSGPAREVYHSALPVFILESEIGVFCELLRACPEILTFYQIVTLSFSVYVCV